jgi:chemotaxis family two-component system response regulator Rcp1
VVPRLKTLLIVDDSDADVELIRLGLAEHEGRLHIERVRDGEEALAYLRQQGEWRAAARPDLVLLDLNLPRLGGREVLARMKQDPALMRIPVVVMTTSALDGDVASVYGLGANCFVTKPLDLDRFVAAMRAMQEFWLSTATLPPA